MNTYEGGGWGGGEPKTAVIAREQGHLLLLGLCDRD